MLPQVNNGPEWGAACPALSPQPCREFGISKPYITLSRCFKKAASTVLPFPSRLQTCSQIQRMLLCFPRIFGRSTVICDANFAVDLVESVTVRLSAIGYRLVVSQPCEGLRDNSTAPLGTFDSSSHQTGPGSVEPVVGWRKETIGRES